MMDICIQSSDLSGSYFVTFDILMTQGQVNYEICVYPREQFEGSTELYFSDCGATCVSVWEQFGSTEYIL